MIQLSPTNFNQFPSWSHLMMSVEFKCEYPGCEVVKEATTEEVALGLLQLHQANAHSKRESKQKPPKVDRPRLTGGSTVEEWTTFVRRWETFKAATDMSPEEAKSQLLACCESCLLYTSPSPRDS